MTTENLKNIIRNITLLMCMAFGLAIGYIGFFVLKPDSIMGRIAQEHFEAVIGLPCAGAGALFLVLLLKQTAGEIEFKALTFEFKGASGEIVLWILTLLSITFAIHMLW